MWHHEFEELIRVHRLNPMGSYYPGTAGHHIVLTTSFKFLLDFKTIDNVLKTIVNALLVDACNQTIILKALKK